MIIEITVAMCQHLTFLLFGGKMFSWISALGADIKNNPGIAIIFTLTGIIIGLSAHNGVMSFFNSKFVLVVADSYIEKSEVAKSYIPIVKYTQTVEELQKSNNEKEKLIGQNNQITNLLRTQNTLWASAICQRFTQEIDNITIKQDNAEVAIEHALSRFYINNDMKSDKQIDADRILAIELRKRSESLGQQLIQLRNEIAKCAGG